MTYNEALQRATELGKGINTPFSLSEQSEIESLYKEVTGRCVRSCNCTEKWRDALIETLVYLRKNRKMKEKSRYVLRAGVVIQPADGNVYTNDNLTDAVAEEFLGSRPNAAGLFEVIPEIEESIAKDEEEEEQSESAEYLDPTILQAIADALAGGMTKTAARKEFAGKTINGTRLTFREVARYIKAVQKAE